MKTKLFKCNTCGNIMLQVDGGGVTPVCCGKEMTLLESGVTDGNTDYHVPVCEKQQDGSYRITVGSQLHPMTEHHYIIFIYVATRCGGILHKFCCGDTPSITIRTCEEPVAIYAYCNIHGLYVAKCTCCK